MAIHTFDDKSSETFYLTGTVPRNVGWRAVAKVAARKLDMIAYAKILDDLKAPPNNRLEKLKDDLAGFYSIRVNDQWTVVFQWTASGPSKVRIMDYH
ncbi:MAG: type II toxin-antitoxin system RelE/ParE family toxin [Proteobacteria bacterium]|nr:type II toxin-antitoxin system RelE/ParE family toxin [Pseudomonadota bacterium]